VDLEPIVSQIVIDSRAMPQSKKPTKQAKPKQQKKNKTRKLERSSPAKHFSRIGRELGATLAGTPGALIGQAGGALLGHLVGRGAYRVSKNSIMMDPNGPPTFSTRDEGLRVSHREFIADISGTTTFTNTVFPIDPMQGQTFPWMSQVASNFEEYEFNGLVFEYKATSGTAVSSTNTALGTVILGTQYDVELDAFPDKLNMENYEFSTSAVPYCNQMHPVECKPSLGVFGHRYCAPGDGIPSGADPRLYQIGNFQIATTGMQSGVTTIGELWVTYDISFYKPRLPDTTMYSTGVVHLISRPAATSASANIGGTTGFQYTTDSMMHAHTHGYSNNGIWFRNAGAYLVVVTARGGASGGIAASYGANVAVTRNIMYGSSAGSSTSVSSNTAIAIFVVQVTGSQSYGVNTSSSQAMTFTCSGLSGGDCDVFSVGISTLATGIPATNQGLGAVHPSPSLPVRDVLGATLSVSTAVERLGIKPEDVVTQALVDEVTDRIKRMCAEKGYTLVQSEDGTYALA